MSVLFRLTEERLLAATNSAQDLGGLPPFSLPPSLLPYFPLLLSLLLSCCPPCALSPRPLLPSPHVLASPLLPRPPGLREAAFHSPSCFPWGVPSGPGLRVEASFTGKSFAPDLTWPRRAGVGTSRLPQPEDTCPQEDSLSHPGQDHPRPSPRGQPTRPRALPQGSPSLPCQAGGNAARLTARPQEKRPRCSRGSLHHFCIFFPQQLWNRSIIVIFSPMGKLRLGAVI